MCIIKPRRHAKESRAKLVLTVFLAAALSGTSRGQDCGANAEISVGNTSAPGGRVAVELRGGSMCDVTGFSLAIGHDPARVEFESAVPGAFLKSHAGSRLLFSSTGANNAGYMTLVASFGSAPPTAVPEKAHLATLIYRFKPEVRGKVALRNLSGFFGDPPITNIFTTQGSEIRPKLQGGSITRLLQCDDDAVIAVGSAQAPSGEVTAELRGGSACPVTGFRVVIRHDERLEFVGANPGPFLTTHAGSRLVFAATGNESSHVVIVRVAFDSPESVTGNPTSVPLDELLASLRYRIRSGVTRGTVHLEALGESPLDSHFTTQGSRISPNLASGAVLIAPNITLFTRGDADGDGDIDIGDAVSMLSLRIPGGLLPPCLKAADADDNGVLNLNDSAFLLSVLFGGGPALPPPMDCGEDPTEDQLSCQRFPPCE